MIPRDLAYWTVEGRWVTPDSLKPALHPKYPDLADKLLDLFRNGKGKMRHHLEQRVEALMRGDPSCPIRRYQALFNLLEARSTFDTDTERVAYRLRNQVLDLAAPYHPLVRSPKLPGGTSEVEVKKLIAARLGRSWEKIEAGLFADMQDFHTLLSFESYADARELLNRYNVAQCQALFHFCTSLRVEVTEDLKLILRYSKLAKLMHDIDQNPRGGFIFTFEGERAVVEQTTRYGGAMGQFILSLLRCKGWSLKATIKLPKKDNLVYYQLSHESRLLPCWPDETKYDSSIEEGFAKKWGTERREGWLLGREDEVLWQHQRTFTPDFSFTHTDGRRVLMEIAGFWTEDYIRRKKETILAFGPKNILLVVPEKLAGAYADLGCRVVIYKTAILPDAVLAALQNG